MELTEFDDDNCCQDATLLHLGRPDQLAVLLETWLGQFPAESSLGRPVRPCALVGSFPMARLASRELMSPC